MEENQAPLKESPQYRYPGFWVRLIAYSVDQTVLFVASQVLSYLALFGLYAVARVTQSPPPESFGAAFDGGFIQIIFLLSSLALTAPYYIASIHYYGGTVGKLLMRMRVIDVKTGQYPSLGRSTGRFFASFLSAVFMGAGYVMVAFNRQKRALHDILSETLNVYVEKGASDQAEPSDGPTSTELESDR